MTPPLTGPYCHPWEARLRGPTNFRAVLSARRLSSANFTIAWRHTDAATARLGLIVSRRTSRSAVQRNRLKRVVRESFRHHRAHLGRMDVVVTVRASAVPCSGPLLLLELAGLWTRLCHHAATRSA